LKAGQARDIRDLESYLQEQKVIETVKREITDRKTYNNFR